MVDAVLAFALVAGLMTVTPGIDTALVLRTAASRGRRPAFAVAAGICAGCLVWGVAAALGVSALLTASPTAFTVLRIAGTAYLLFLGARLLRQAFPHVDADADPAASALNDPATDPHHGEGPRAVRGLGLRFWRQGFLTNLLNPKVAAFYVALLPQFIPPDQPAALAGAVLALVHAAEGMVWFTALILVLHGLGAALRRPAVRRAIDAVTGVTIIGFGLKLAATPA